MTVVLVGVGADSGNVRPRPQLDDGRRFEYVPIPEKSRRTTESRTFGSMPQRHGDGTLADLVDGIRPHADAAWLTDEARVRRWPVHYDPNFEALTYGEGGKDQNVSAIETLGVGDILGFYTGLETDGRMHRYVFGYLTVATTPAVVDDPTDDRIRNLCRSHPANAHAKRFEAGGLYAFDPERPPGASRVAFVDGRTPGGLLDRALRLSGSHDGGHFYMREAVVDLLDPSTDYLGGFKPPVVCDCAPAAFLELLDSAR